MEEHGGSLRLNFTFQGARCREVLRDMPPTARNRKSAELLLVEINEKIKHGVFDYASYFPDSKRADKLAEAEGRYTTVGQYLDAFMRTKTSLADATRSQYANDVLRWKEWLGEDTSVMKLSTTRVVEVVNGYAWPSNQRFNNAMSPLRGALRLARKDHPRLPDWLEEVEFREPEEGNPDPVTQADMLRVLAWIKANRDPRCWAYFAWAFATGMRPEEIVAILWSDVHIELGKVSVNKTRSFRGRDGKTKTKGSNRLVDLSPLALQALAAMEPWTKRDGKEVFQNPWTDRRWHDGRSPRENVWIPALKALRIEARRAYCTRHTFATLLLQAGARVAYVSAQMGHTTPSQVEDTYAKWLPDADGGFARARMAEAFGATTSAPAHLKLATG